MRSFNQAYGLRMFQSRMVNLNFKQSRHFVHEFRRECLSENCECFFLRYVTALKKIFVSSLDTVSALAFVSGAANKYFEKTSIPVRTNLYTVDFSGPTMSICIMSPGKHCIDKIGCNGGIWYFADALLSCNHVKQFLMVLVRNSVNPRR